MLLNLAHSLPEHWVTRRRKETHATLLPTPLDVSSHKTFWSRMPQQLRSALPSPVLGMQSIDFDLTHTDSSLHIADQLQRRQRPGQLPRMPPAPMVNYLPSPMRSTWSKFFCAYSYYRYFNRHRDCRCCRHRHCCCHHCCCSCRHHCCVSCFIPASFYRILTPFKCIDKR